MEKSLRYKRIWNLENQTNTSPTIRKSKTKKKNMFINRTYIQWTGKSPQCKYNDITNKPNLERIRDLYSLLSKFTNTRPDFVVAGDLKPY